MNLKSLVVVVLRLMSLDFLIRAAVQTIPSLVSFLSANRGTPIGEQIAMTQPIIIVVAGLVVSAFALWIFAPQIALLATQQAAPEISLGALTLADCYSIAFLGIGLFYIATGVPSALMWACYLFKTASASGDSWKEKVDWYQAAQAIIPLLIGILLFVRGREWSLKLARKHLEMEALNPKPGGSSESQS